MSRPEVPLWVFTENVKFPNNTASEFVFKFPPMFAHTPYNQWEMALASITFAPKVNYFPKHFMTGASYFGARLLKNDELDRLLKEVEADNSGERDVADSSIRARRNTMFQASLDEDGSDVAAPPDAPIESMEVDPEAGSAATAAPMVATAAPMVATMAPQASAATETIQGEEEAKEEVAEEEQAEEGEKELIGGLTLTHANTKEKRKFWRIYLRTEEWPKATLTLPLRDLKSPMESVNPNETQKFMNWFTDALRNEALISNQVYDPVTQELKTIHSAPVATVRFWPHAAGGPYSTDLFLSRHSIVYMPALVAHLLGFRRNFALTPDGSTAMFFGYAKTVFRSQVAVDLNAGIPHSMNLLCDVVESSLVGNVYSPLLKIIPIPNQNENDDPHRSITYEVQQTPEWHRIVNNDLNEVGFKLLDSTGNPIDFVNARQNIIISLLVRAL